LCQDINVTVTVTTSTGTATAPFHYDGIWAADGDGGGTEGIGGELWLIDPYTAQAFDFGPILDANGTDYPISGMTFDGSGTLWAVTTGDGQDAGPNNAGETASELVTIDAFNMNGPTVTVIGNAVGSNKHSYMVTDIKTSGGVLYGWAYDVTAKTTTQGLVSINMTTGAVTAIGTPVAQSFAPTVTGTALFQGGLELDGSGGAFVAANGASTDDGDGASGEFDSVDLTTGAVTNTGTPLDWSFEGLLPIGAPVNSMEFFGIGIAVIDNGAYGAIEADPQTDAPLGTVGNSLAIIDPAGPANGGAVVNPVFDLPATLPLQSAVDGIAILSSPTATISIAKRFVKLPAPTSLKTFGGFNHPAFRNHVAHH
jgi:hypothetical protein